MENAGRPLGQKVILVVLILGLLAFVLYFVLYINPAQVAEILSKTNLFYYAGAFVAYSVYTIFSSLVWRSLLRSLSMEISTRKALLFTWVGLFFDATVPQLGWSGEISKTYLLTKDSSLSAGKIGASVVIQKIFNMTITVVAMSIGLGLMLVGYPLPFIVAFLISLVLGLLILTLSMVYYISIKPSATKTLLNWAVSMILFFRKTWNPESFTSKAERLLTTFHDGMQYLRGNSKALVKPIIYSVTSFIFEISVTFITFAALGYPIPVDKVLIVFTLTGTLQTVGVTFFGFPELIMSISFTALGIPAALSVSVTILTRVVSLWFRLIVSYAALQWAGIKIILNK
ncbi:MAG: lysylphosphatidylglycerol synthase transmembrane domain-containing protein [Candidatus Bathyarchaeia archaeon]|jgi:uncharacterized protein (TIRG00374 family)